MKRQAASAETQLPVSDADEGVHTKLYQPAKSTVGIIQPRWCGLAGIICASMRGATHEPRESWWLIR